jgi:nicotinamidase-related amidase
MDRGESMKLSDSGPQSFAEAVSPKHTALVLHDVQNDFCTEGGKIYRRAAKHPENIAGAIAALAKLAKAARAAGAKVIYFQQMHLPNAADIPAAHVHHLVSNKLASSADDIPCIRGTWGHQIVDSLKPEPGDIVVDKASFNDFHDSIADKVLRIQGVETVILTGVSTHAGVIATVFGLLDCGYRYFVPRECVSGYVPELHECALKIIGPYVVAVAQITEAWSKARS